MGRPLAGYDVTTYSVANRVQATLALRNLRLPQWDPFRLGGVPFLANPQAAVLYPFHWLLAALPMSRAQGISLCLHVAIGGIGAYAFARRAVAASPWAGFVAGGSFALGGFVHAHAGHYEQLTAICWLPWALLACDLAIDSGRRRLAGIAGLACALALTGLAGHTQYLHMSIAAVSLYALVVSRPWTRVVGAIAGVVLGLGLAAAQLVPTALLAGRSLRSGGLPFGEATAESLALGESIAAFLPPYAASPRLSVEEWAWLPWAVLAAAVLGAVSARAGERRVPTALVLMAAAGLLLALGGDTPAYRIAFELVPGTSLFRVPSRWLFLPALAVPVLAAAGVDALREGRAVTRSMAGVCLALLAAFALGLSLQRSTPSTTVLALGAAAAAVVVAARVAVGLRPRVAPALAGVVVAVVAVELLAANSDAYVRWLRMDRDLLLPRSATAAALDDASGGRVLAMGSEDLGDFGGHRRALRPNAHVFDRLRSVDGYDGGLLYTRRWRDAIVALTGESGLVAVNTARSAFGVRRLDRDRFLELDTTRVVVHQPTFDPMAVLPEGSALLRTVGDVAIYETPSHGPVFLAGGDVPAGLRLGRDIDHPERLEIDVPAAAGGRIVVVSESFDPGWHASDNVVLGRHHDLLMSFRAPPEGGRVVLTYRTPGLRIGLLASLASLAVTAWLFVLARRR